jgi:hypothetical protein
VIKLLLEYDQGFSSQSPGDQSKVLKNAIGSAEFLKNGLHVIEASWVFIKKVFIPLDFHPSSDGFQRIIWIWH